jgi:hypothetical protein
LTGAALAAFGLPHVAFESVAGPGRRIDATTPVGEGWDLGREISVDQAMDLTGRSLVWPSSLGRPDHVYLLEIGKANLVSIVYSPRDGFPAPAGVGPGVLIVEIRGALETLDVTKRIPEDGRVEPVDLDGLTGYWVSGRFHQFALDAHNGEHLLQQAAGETLVWEAAGSVYRLESRGGQAAAIGLAQEMIRDVRSRHSP